MTNSTPLMNENQIGIRDALEEKRPIPPWRQKLVDDLKPNPGRSADMRPAEPVPVKHKRNYRRLITPLVVLLLFIELLISTGVEIVQVVRKSIETLILAIESFINEPDRKPPAD